MEKELPIPYYLQVAETIRSRILAGYYTPGDLIPSYRDLEKEFNVSNITIRKAVEMLVREKIIRRKRGVGTIVSEADEEMMTFKLSGDFQAMRDSRKMLETEVLDVTTTPTFPARVRQVLGLAPGEDVWRMRKIRRHKETIMAYYVHYGRCSSCSTITAREAEKEGFADLFRRCSGIQLTRLEQRLEAGLADLDLSAILRVNFGAPLLFAENVYFSVTHEAVALTQIYYRGDRNSYITTARL